MINKLLYIDRASFIWCNRYQSVLPLTQCFRFISKTGDGPLYVVFSLLLLSLNTELGLSFLGHGLMAFLIELPLYFIIKTSIKRDRPFVRISGAKYAFTPSDKFSLPSGHTAGACVMASLICVYFPVVGLLAFIWAGLVGLSRVMLGVHYPSDIIAGVLLGVGCAALSFFLLMLLGWSVY